jgi:hypothetical protein
MFCLTTLLLAIFYAPVLFFDREFFVSDHAFYFEPFAKFMATSYIEGHVPLWNPYLYCGMPQLANPSPGIFYFPNFLFIGLSYSKAMGLILMLHQLVAFSAAYLLIESLGWGVVAAAFCGVLMAFNGYMMSLSANYTLPGTAAWGLLAVYGLVNINRPVFARPAQRAGFVVLTALSVHWMIMAGRPEVFVPMMALLGVAAVFFFFGWIDPFIVDGTATVAKVPANWRQRSVILGWQIGAMCLGILLSGPSLLPVYEWSKLSPRASGLTMDNVMKWSSNWYDMVCMLCPQPLGDLQQPTSKYLTYVASHANHYPFLPSPLIGPVAITLFLLGLFDRTFKARWHVLGGLCVALLLALGKYGPLSAPVLKVVPFLLVLRYPCKLLIVVIFFAAILGSRGLFVVWQDRVKLWQKKVLVGFWVALIAVAGVLTFANQYCGDHLGKLPAHMIYLVGFSLFISSVIGLFVSLLITFSTKIKLAAPHLAGILMLLTIASVFAPAMKNAPRTVAAGFFARPQAVAGMLDKYVTEQEKSQSARLAVVYFDPLNVSEGYVPRYPNQLGETFMQYARELLLPNTNIDSKVRETFGYEASENKDFRKAFIRTLHLSSSDRKGASDVEIARFCLISGTKFLASQIENDKGQLSLFNPAHFRLLLENIPMNVRIYEVLSRRPRAFFARSYRTIASQDEAVEEIFAPENKNALGTACEFEKNVLVELDQKTDVTTDPLSFNDHAQSRANAALSGAVQPKPSFSKVPVVSIDPSQAASPKVEFLVDDCDRVSISVNTQADGFVVLNDRFYPGWHAMLDTQPAIIYRANAFMRAVYVGKGSHLVEFRYEPESLRNGVYLALIALVVIAFLLAVYLKEPAAAFVNYLSTGKRPEAKESVEKEGNGTQERSAVLDLGDKPS